MRLFLAVLLIACFASTARAQQADVTSPSAADAAAAHHQAEAASNLSAPASAEAAEPSHGPGHGARVATALLGGSLAAGAMVGVTAAAVYGAAQGCSDDVLFDSECVLKGGAAMLYLPAFAYAPAIAAGAWGGGELLGGEGRYDLTLLGSSIGTALGFGALAGIAHADPSDRAFGASMALVPVLQVAGAVVGYHLSAKLEAGTPSLTPVVAADDNGGLLGVRGEL